MKSVFALTLILSISAFAKLPTKKKFLSAPTELCHPVQCIKFAPGVVFYYDDARKNLGLGTLAEDVEIGGIKAPRGAKIGFANPADPFRDYQFYILTKEAQTWGGVTFAEDTAVKFVRFDASNVPLDKGAIQVKGTIAKSTKIEGLPFAPGEVIFKATVEAGTLKDAQYIKGIADDHVFIPAPDPIELYAGDTIEVVGDLVEIQSARRSFGTAGCFGRNAKIWRATGKLYSISLEEPFTHNKMEFTGEIKFHSNGNVRLGSLSKDHTILGIRASKAVSGFSGEIAFYENGSPVTFTTRYVDDNAAFLPPDFSDLPSELHEATIVSSAGGTGRLQFFFGPKGEYRAVKREEYKHGVSSFAKNRESYTVKALADGLEFTAVKAGTELDELLRARVGSPSKELEQYLTTGVVAPKKP